MTARLLMLAALLVIPSFARADAPEIEIARGHSRRAAELYAAARFSEAAAELELARKELPLPELDYNLGRCYEAIGDVDAALDAYRRFTTKAPASPARVEVEERMRLLELASPRVHVRQEHERRREHGLRVWRRTYPPSIALGALAVIAGVTSATLYPSLLHERDRLATPCPPQCTSGNYAHARSLETATLATFGVALSAAAIDVALWSVALSARSRR